jgi:hypothetical protein
MKIVVTETQLFTLQVFFYNAYLINSLKFVSD